MNLEHTALLEEKLRLADLDIKDGYYQEAVRKLEDLIAQEPNYGKTYNHMGFLHETKFKQYEKAAEYYEMALERAPGYTSAYYNYAVLLSTLGKYDRLQQLLEQALTVEGIDKATIYNEYGIMYEQQGDYENALKYYRDTIRATLNKDVLNKAKESLERCQTKMELLS